MLVRSSGPHNVWFFGVGFRISRIGLHHCLGFRTDKGIDFSLWLRNAFDQDYFEQLVVTPGSTGLIAGLPGDPRTFGATLRYQF